MDIAPTHAERTAERTADMEASWRTPAISSGTRPILIVDDSRYIRELLTLHLSNAGYDVVAAQDAVTALRFLIHERPSLLLADVEMPYMDGFELLKAVKGDPVYTALPVIFLTAREDAKDRAMTLGAHACLHKPLFVQELLTAVAAALNTGRVPIG